MRIDPEVLTSDAASVLLGSLGAVLGAGPKGQGARR
jgi:hypothetical protein